jgi:hypothetical protein
VPIFLAQRPQQPVRLSPNLDLSWQGITTPARPASRTSDSVIPLHKQTYMDLLLGDYEKRSQYAIVPSICQASIFSLYSAAKILKRVDQFRIFAQVILDGRGSEPDKKHFEGWLRIRKSNPHRALAAPVRLWKERPFSIRRRTAGPDPERGLRCLATAYYAVCSGRQPEGLRFTPR